MTNVYRVLAVSASTEFVTFGHQKAVVFFLFSGTTVDATGDMSIQVGSLLDDGQWHDVEVRRNEENVSLTVDQLTMTNVSTSDFYQLDLDRQVDGLSINVFRADLY